MSRRPAALLLIFGTIGMLACEGGHSDYDAATSPADAANPPPADAWQTWDAPDAKPSEPISSLSLEQVWYLTRSVANNVLIDFRSGSPVVTCNGSVGVSDGWEGTAVFTEPSTGALYFYTDGRNVFNGQTNQLVDNGSALTGDVSTTEPALIAPKYGSDDQVFYIFTNNTNVSSPSTIAYSVIDLSVGANGTITDKNVTLLDGNPGEALDVLPHANGKDFWVLAYDGGDTIKAFLVDDVDGVTTTPVVSATGLTGEVRRGAINHTYDYQKVALGQNYGGANGTIAVGQFDRTTGAVSSVVTIATGDVGYHASFSEDGSKVYFVRGTEGWSGQAYQYDLDTSTETLLGGTGMAAAKLAPDGKLYWAACDKSYMGVVADPNAAGAAAGFVQDGLYLEGCLSGWGVPNQTAAYEEYIPPIP